MTEAGERLRRDKQMRFGSVLLLILMFESGCSDPKREPSLERTTANSRAQICAGLEIPLAGPGADRYRVDTGFARSIVQQSQRLTVETVIRADSIDLDCDGRFDLIAYISARPENKVASERILVAFSRQHEENWVRVLWSPSPVDGIERLLIAAPLTTSNRRDIVSLGSDEGGYVPRVFLWANLELAEVRVPARYALRLEEDWDVKCLQLNAPRLVGDHHVVMSRESITPRAKTGHGKKCDLPVDTLFVRRDSLVWR